jgi:hypothetical protein
VQKQEFSKHAICAIRTLDNGRAHSLQTNTSSRRKGCYISTIKASVQLQKVSGRDLRGAWRQDELTGGKPPVVKLILIHSLKG